MKWTGLNDLRRMYLEFFASKGHLVLPSAPLVPRGDNSILLINAGMTPLKKYFSKQEVPPCNRIASCQKCIRTPDIENVGKTARHGTYFEMLGNFSFGDYFKEEAIAWAWEFFTQVLEIPKELLYVSVFEDDDEARDIWVHQEKVDPSHVVKMGREDNFWEHGSGPCGPCTEIYFDRGPEHGCGKPDCKVGCDCDRYVEVWNVVFSQFNNDGQGNYTPLAQKNIDTGMGLERLACVMQNVDNIFLVDTVQKILQKVVEISGVAYGQSEKTDISIRVITDHIRSTTFMVADGVLPQNEGRGYVLRRLLRRAARHGRLLGINGPFLSRVCDTVIAENKLAYPELEQKADYIKRVILTEEERFEKTINQGMEMLAAIIDQLSTQDIKNPVLDGASAFKLYDTFGFPVDLTREIAEEKHIQLDEDGFKELMNQQRQTAKANMKNNDAFAGGNHPLDNLLEEPTVFVGYDTLKSDATLVGIVAEDEEITTAKKGDVVVLALDATPFYAESGGQMADMGLIVTKAGDAAKVLNVTKTAKGIFLHKAQITEGSLSVGQQVHCRVDEDNRLATGRNHTAAHLLQAALRQVLGDHVHQAGSMVNASHVRFDFTHFSAMTQEELRRVEQLVNEKILANLPVVTEVLPLEEANRRGAMALFGEKYGDTVRVVTVPDFSVEFCGGTHMTATGTLGLFRIISESSVAAGVRRIEGTTGTGVLQLLDNAAEMLNRAAATIKLANPAELIAKLSAIVSENKGLRSEVDSLEEKIADAQFKEMFSKANDIGDVKFFATTFMGLKVEALRKLGDRMKEASPEIVAIISTVNEGKTTVLCICGQKAVELGADANKVVKAITAVTGGGGGGKKDNAMAGIKDQYSLDEALIQMPDFVRSMVSQ